MDLKGAKMKKSLFILLFIISSIVFSETEKTITKDTGKIILDLIKEVEEDPASEVNLPKYERIIKFAEESEDVQIFLIDDVYRFQEAKISEKNRKLLQGAYTAGALKKQLENKQKIITISDGIKNELTVYKILRETKYVKVEYLEWLLDVERQGGIGQIFYDYDVMGMEIYQNSLGVPKDIDTLWEKFKIPVFINVSDEKILITNMDFSMLADLSTIIGFQVISNDYDKTQKNVDSKAKEITKKLLDNKTIKNIYNKENYSGIIIEFVSPKAKLSKEEVYKIMVKDDKDVAMKEEVKQRIFEKEEIKKWEKETEKKDSKISAPVPKEEEKTQLQNK